MHRKNKNAVIFMLPIILFLFTSVKFYLYVDRLYIYICVDRQTDIANPLESEQQTFQTAIANLAVNPNIQS